MTKEQARSLIKAVQRELDDRLDGSRSQFGIRLSYVQAYEDMKAAAQKIVNELEAK